LAIEEAAKAWMLYIKLLVQGSGSRYTLPVAKAEREQLESYLKSNASYLEELDSEIVSVFREHKVKLRFMRFLLGYFKKLLSIVAKKELLRPFVEKIRGPAFTSPRS
jgi:hypothetical protein